MSRIYCQKVDGFEFVVYPHYHKHIVVIKVGKTIVCKPLFSAEAFNPPNFEVNVSNAYFHFKNRTYSIRDSWEQSSIPDWFMAWNKSCREIKLTMSAQEKFVWDGIDEKRDLFMRSIGFYN